MKAGLAAALVLLLQGDAGDAARRFEGGDFAGAARAYATLLDARPESAVLRYDLGTALLRLERWEAAREALAAAARGTDGRAADGPLRPSAYYNLGNADLQPAHAAPADEAVREALVRAVVAYKRALLLDPSAEDARWNLELARRLLDRLPPPPEPAGGGGGGSGGGGDDPQRGRNDDPMPRPSGGSGAGPPMTREAAERLLAAAAMREADVQRETLRKPQPRNPTAH